MKKGFTLIELMVVIVIIGVLAAIAIPRLTSMSAKAKIAEAPQALGTYERLQDAFITEVDSVGTGTQIKFVAPSSKWFTYAANTTAGTATATLGKAVGDCGTANVFSSVKTNATKDSAWTRAIAGTATLCQAYVPNFK